MELIGTEIVKIIKSETVCLNVQEILDQLD